MTLGPVQAHALERREQQLGDREVAMPLVVAGHDVPRRVVGMGALQGEPNILMAGFMANISFSTGMTSFLSGPRSKWAKAVSVCPDGISS